MKIHIFQEKLDSFKQIIQKIINIFLENLDLIAQIKQN